MTKISDLFRDFRHAFSMSRVEASGLLSLTLILLTLAAVRFFASADSTGPQPLDSAQIHWVAELKAQLQPRQTLKKYSSKPRIAAKTSNSPAATTLANNLPSAEKEQEWPLLEIDINRSTSEELTRIYGVGPVLSKRIIKYRNLLGGFVHEMQLAEVYGLSPEALAEIQKQTIVKGLPETIPVNTDSIRLLAKHPYISYSLAKAIVNYRKQHGDYKALEEIRTIKILNDSLYHRLSPYLSL